MDLHRGGARSSVLAGWCTPPGRGAVLCARYSCGPRGRGPPGQPSWDGHGPPCPHFVRRTPAARSAVFGDRSRWAAVGCGRGAVLCARVLADGEDAVPPGLRGQGPRGGAQSAVPVILPDRGNAVRPKQPLMGGTVPRARLLVYRRGRGAVLCARALSNGEAAAPHKDPFSERHSPLRPCSSGRRGRRPSRFKRPGAAGRGTVPCARYSSGPRGRGPSQATPHGGHDPPCLLTGVCHGGVTVPPACLFHHGGCPTVVIGRKEMDWPSCDC
jgi:hypothetical protein